MELRKTARAPGEERLDLFQQPEARVGLERIAEVLDLQVGNRDDGDVTRGQLAIHAGAAVRAFILCMVQTLDLVDPWEGSQDQALVVPQGDGAILVTQPLAHTRVERLTLFGTLSTE